MTTAPIIVGLLIAALVYSSLRTGAVERWCRSRGMEYLGKTPVELQTRHTAVQELLGDGRVANWGAAVSGVSGGVPVVFLEHEWATGVADSRRVQWCTFAILQSAKARLPRFALAPQAPRILKPVVAAAEAAASNPREAFGLADRDLSTSVEFDDDPEFSRRYRVVGDPVGVRAILTPQVRASLTGTPLDGRLAADGSLLVWQTPGLPDAAKLDTMVAHCVRLRQLFGV